MFLAADGVPDLWLLAATLVGGMLAAGGANALNCYYDRDIDQLMVRTGHRPLVTGQVSPRGALVFGLALCVASIVWFALTTNLLAALLAVVAILAYVGRLHDPAQAPDPAEHRVGRRSPGACRC